MAMGQSKYQLALADLESFLKPEAFLYVLTVVMGDNKVEDGPSKIDSNELAIASSNSSQLLGESRGTDDPPHPKIIQSRNTMRSSSTDSSERVNHNYLLSPMEMFHRRSAALPPSPGSVLCSQLPICRRLFNKYEHSESIKRRTRTRSRESVVTENGAMALDTKYKSPFQKIVGKINPDEPLEFDRGRKLKKAPPGVRKFSNPVSNPLYKNYNPLGYIKNDDEIAREFILKITDTFNEWLASFDGVLTQLDPEMMIKTLRDDLELSFNKPSTFHGVKTNKTDESDPPAPVVYKSRFRFDQPKFKLDLA